MWSSWLRASQARGSLGQFQLLVVFIRTAYAWRVRDRWSGLELRYLVTLAEVGRLASFSKAADALGDTQDDGDLLADLEGGKLDLTFVVFPLTPGPFEAVELLEDPYVLAVPEDSELARRPSPVSPRHLDGVPLITYAQMREVHSIENRLGRPQVPQPIGLQAPHKPHLL